MTFPFSIISDKRLQQIKNASFEEGVKTTLEKDPVKLAEAMKHTSEFSAIFDFTQVISITRKFIGSNRETTMLERSNGHYWEWACDAESHNKLVSRFLEYQKGAVK